MEYKVCSKCGESKSIEDFPLRSKNRNTRRTDCRACCNERSREGGIRRKQCPDYREKERLRLKTLQENRTEEQLKAESIAAQIRNKIKSDKIKEDFFAKHGCTKQELKWREDKDEFIKNSLLRNGDKYNYNEIEYLGVNIPVKIWCNKHNLHFNQTPKSHKRGAGCPECGNEATGNGLRKSQEDFIKEAIDLCGDRYTFEDVEYIDSQTPVDVTCKIHGNFPIRPGNLLQGKGCPSCAKYGYNISKPGTLYVLKYEELTKVGITNKTVEFRLKQINNSSNKTFSILASFPFESGKQALNLETCLLGMLRADYEQPTEVFDGSTECFYDVDHDQLFKMIEQKLTEMEIEPNGN